ncbi:hypothetical protein KC334_g8287, partial [Hortaea werneckii]
IAFDPYTYSQGKWLHRNEERQTARKLHFNFEALLEVAVKRSEGAREVVSCEKREGGFNRIFVIEFDNGAKVAAKVPMPYAGPTALMTMSEVATLKYVRHKTHVPVPQVLAWSSKPESDSVGIEYIMMEHVSGVALKDIWGQMTELQHILIIESVGKLVKELCALDFGALGSLYLNTADKPLGTLPVDEEYCVGPHCGRHLWGYHDDHTTKAAVPTGLQGPWQDFSKFFADLTQIGELTVAERELPQKLPEDHLRLLETSLKTLEVVKNSMGPQDARCPLLFHPDLHARNIFVDSNDPTQVLSVIDWQCTGIEPAVVHAVEQPHFAEEPLLDKTLDAETTHDSHELQAHAQRCKTAWAAMILLCPKLGKAVSLDHDLCRYLANVACGYSDDMTTPRSLLRDVSRKWDELGLPGVCSYQPSKEDAKLLDLELDQLRSTQRLREYLSRSLRCETDGWVEERRWDDVVHAYREEYAGFVKACVASREECETEEDAERKADKLWPFDLR